MTRILILMFALLILAPGVRAGEMDAIAGRDDQVSYSVGHQVGRDLDRQGVKVNAALVLQGVLDAVEHKGPRISYDEMLDILSTFRERILERAKQSQVGMMRAGEKFLSDNAHKKGVVTRDSGLQYLVVRAGTGRKPGAGETVTVNYVARDINGKVFDSSYEKGEAQPARLQLEHVIPGWQEALPLMSEGSKWELYVPSRLAYRDKTPLAGQAVIFELELLKIGE